MLSVIGTMAAKRREIVLNEEYIQNAAESAIEAIKGELPEETHTVEIIDYVISEMKQLLNEKRIIL